MQEHHYNGMSLAAPNLCLLVMAKILQLKCPYCDCFYRGFQPIDTDPNMRQESLTLVMAKILLLQMCPYVLESHVKTVSV
jgi:hypothetical protein